MSIDRLPGIEFDLSDTSAWANWMRDAFSSQPRRWAHVHEVWRRVREWLRLDNCPLTPEEAKLLELAAILHDVGRILDPNDTEPHAFVGARYLDSLGLHELAVVVAHHSGARFEAELRSHSHRCKWRFIESPVASALTYLDMTTDADGRVVSVEARRQGIASTYGEASFQVRAFDRVLDEIETGRLLIESSDE